MTPDQLNRVRKYINALPVLKTLGWDPWIPLAHSWHESGAFSADSDGKRKMLDAFNSWGIKKRKNWTGPTVKVVTHEWVPHRADPNSYKSDPNFISVDRVISGVKDYIRVYAEFMAFTSQEAALLWYDDFIANSPNYKDAYAKRNDPDLYFKLLVDTNEPGEQAYATDPNYVIQCERIYSQLKTYDGLMDMMKVVGLE